MPHSLSDWITSLAGAVIMSGAFLYAAVYSLMGRWRRRRGRGRGCEGDGFPPAYVFRQAFEESVERDQVVASVARGIVVAEYRRVGALYEEPTQPPVNR